MKGSIIVLISLVLGAGLGYVLQLVLSRMLSLSDFGLFYAILSFVGLLFGLKQIGTGPAFVRYVTEYKTKNDICSIKKVLITFLLIQLVLFGILCLVILLLSGYLTNSYFKTDKAFWPLIIITGAYFFSIFMSAFRGFFNAYQKMGMYSIVEFLQTLLFLVSAFILMRINNSTVSASWAFFISYLLVAIICFIFVMTLFPFFKVKAKLDVDIFKKLIRFGIPVTIGMIGTSLITSMDVSFLTYFYPLEKVGLYGIAVTIAGVSRFIPRSLTAILLPVTTELYITENTGLSAGISRLFRLLAVVVLPCAMLLTVLSNQTILVLFGTKFLGAAEAVPFQAWAIVFYSFFLVNQTILLGIHKPRIYAFIIVTGVIIGVVANLLFVPHFGMIGAGIADALTCFMITVQSLWYLRKYLHITLPWRAWIKTLVASGLLIVPVFFVGNLHLNVFLQIIAVVAPGVILYTVALFLLKVIHTEDINTVLSMIRRKKMSAAGQA
jgi:O-antigen/teichoic acid export membrane protein